MGTTREMRLDSVIRDCLEVTLQVGIGTEYWKRRANARRALCMTDNPGHLATEIRLRCPQYRQSDHSAPATRPMRKLPLCLQVPICRGNGERI